MYYFMLQILDCGNQSISLVKPNTAAAKLTFFYISRDGMGN